MVKRMQAGRAGADRGLPDLYFSGDVEADGPIPGPYSMVSLGVSCVASFDGVQFERRDPRADTFYGELKPISKQWVPEALAVSGLTREHLIANGRRPQEAIPELAAWVRHVARGFTPVFVGYPLGFDWMFTYWYLVRFGNTPGKVNNSPFGHSAHLDMKSIYSVKAGAPVSRSTTRSMPEHLLAGRPLTHHPLEDAIDQGELFCNLMEWPGG